LRSKGHTRSKGKGAKRQSGGTLIGVRVHTQASKQSKERAHSSKRGAQIPRRAHFPRNSKAKLKKELAIVPGSFVIFPCCYFSLRSP
jgi:hypothetical protein